MVFFRWFLGIPAAAVITAGLFVLMAGLISQDPVIGDPIEPPVFDILAKEVNPPPEKPRPDGKIINEEPPDPVITRTLPSKKPTGIGGLPERTGPVIERRTDPSQASLPPMRIAPTYPKACSSRGAEGIVIAQFDVTPEGNVVNIQILESADPCFDRTVRNTVAKWRYPPDYQNGRPVMRYAVVERFNFTLEDG